MQRLEVSCAVRLIYTSLGAKGLIQAICIQFSVLDYFFIFKLSSIFLRIVARKMKNLNKNFFYVFGSNKQTLKKKFTKVIKDLGKNVTTTKFWKL